MKKAMHILLTIMIMLIASIVLVWVVDGMVQIDGDIGMMILLLAIANGLILFISHCL